MKLSQIHIRDPFILPYNNKYYLYGSSRQNDTENTIAGFDVYISDDLVEWSKPISVFNKTENFWGQCDFWAPEVHHYKGKFYMFASFKGENYRRGTGILVSDAPDKPFKPLSEGPVTPKEWECLDGTLYVAKCGKPYIIFCHEWVQIHDGEMCAVELTSDLKSPAGDPIVLFKASEPSWADKNKTDFVTDGPFIYKTINGKLLMIWSSLANNGDYVEAIAYPDNNEITGNWKHFDEPLFNKDGGHGMIFENFNNELYFVFHTPNTDPLERPTLLKITDDGDKIEFKK